jgi:twitching motility protein PilT
VDLALKIGNRRFRGNLYWSNGKRLGLVMRQFPEAPPGLATLGLPAAFSELIKNSRGLVLVTGATGSGKSTTLAAALEYINSHTQGHIITIEDPVEYLIRSKKCTVDQRQVGRDVASFEAGLRSAMRQDPDVLLVGELRDPETVKTALDAANTGHLVLGTLHTNSALQAIDRLNSFFPPERQAWVQATLSQALLGVLSQVLVPRRDGKGQVLATELMVNTPDVRQLVREGRTHQIFNAMDTGSSKGQLLLNRNLADLVKTKVITEEEAILSTYDIIALRKELYRV